VTRHPWNDRRSKKKSKSKKRHDEFHEDRPPSQAESLESLLDVMLHVLLISTCPLCSSSGRIPDGSPVVDGKAATGWTVCACRRQAWGLLAEWELGPMAEEGQDPEDGEDDGDEGKDEGFEEVNGG